MRSMGIVKDWLMKSGLMVKGGVERHHHDWNICIVSKTGEYYTEIPYSRVDDIVKVDVYVGINTRC